MNITLPKLLEQSMEHLVKAGAFSSKSDLVRTAIREWFGRNGVKLPEEELDFSYGVPKDIIEKIKKEAGI